MKIPGLVFIWKQSDQQGWYLFGSRVSNWLSLVLSKLKLVPSWAIYDLWSHQQAGLSAQVGPVPATLSQTAFRVPGHVCCFQKGTISKCTIRPKDPPLMRWDDVMRWTGMVLMWWDEQEWSTALWRGHMWQTDWRHSDSAPQHVSWPITLKSSFPRTKPCETL